CTSNGTTAVEYQDTIEFRCKPVVAHTDYKWWHNGRKTVNSRNAILSSNSATLTLSKVTREVNGTYVCEIKNLESSHRSQELKLKIIYGPDSPTLFPSDISFQVGSKIRISCESVSQPKAQYFWTLNGKPWNASREVNINNATLNHTGRYVCTASNPTSNATNSTAREVTVYRK
ncbi:Carcinoembryonic antigen-related cell adhesion molecule 6, partial [Microtus ochrogaster]